MLSRGSKRHDHLPPAWKVLVCLDLPHRGFTSWQRMSKLSLTRTGLKVVTFRLSNHVGPRFVGKRFQKRPGSFSTCGHSERPQCLCLLLHPFESQAPAPASPALPWAQAGRPIK